MKLAEDINLCNDSCLLLLFIQIIYSIRDHLVLIFWAKKWKVTWGKILWFPDLTPLSCTCSVYSIMLCKPERIMNEIQIQVRREIWSTFSYYCCWCFIVVFAFCLLLIIIQGTFFKHDEIETISKNLGTKVNVLILIFLQIKILTQDKLVLWNIIALILYEDFSAIFEVLITKFLSK